MAPTAAKAALSNSSAKKRKASTLDEHQSSALGQGLSSSDTHNILVRIYTSPDNSEFAKEFPVDGAVISSANPFLASEIRRAQDESDSRTISLHKVTPEAFGTYLHWVRNSNIKVMFSNESDDNPSKEVDFFDAYILGHVISDTNFRDALVDSYTEFLFNTWNYPGQYYIRKLYWRLPHPCGLIRYIEHCVVASRGEIFLGKDRNKWPAELLWNTWEQLAHEAAAAEKVKKPKTGWIPACGTYKDPRKGESYGCDYHDHVSEGKECYKTGEWHISTGK